MCFIDNRFLEVDWKSLMLGGILGFAFSPLAAKAHEFV